SATVMMRLFIVAPPSVLSPTRRSSDLGPTMIAQTDRVKSVASAEPAKVTDTRCEKGQRVILAAGRLAGFRACYGACAPVDGGISLDAEAADMLEVGVGDTVWSVPR